MDAFCSTRGMVPFRNAAAYVLRHSREFFVSAAANQPLHSEVEPVKIPDHEVFMHEPELNPSGTPLAPDAAATPEFPPSPSNPLGSGKQVAPWWHTALLLFILVGISTLGGLGTKKQQLAGHQLSTYIFTIAFEWILLAFVWWGLHMRRVPMKSLLGEHHKGWSGFGRNLAYAAVFWVIAYFVLAGSSLLLKALHVGKPGPPQKVIALAPTTPLDFLMWFLVCLSAGICEELVFRGYLLRQFSSIGGKIWIGVVLSSLVFGASHGYEGMAVMIVIFVYGVLFCLLVLKSKSLVPGMIAHGWQDFFTGIAIAVLQHMHRL